MKKTIKKSMALGILALSLSITPISAFAEQTQDKQTNVSASSTQTISSKQKATRAVENYVNVVAENSYPDWKNSKIKYEFELYDFDGNITSHLFVVKGEDGLEKGYIIVSAGEEPVVLESTREGTHPYINYKRSEKDTAIYVGPVMQYVKKENSTDIFLDVREGHEIKKNNLKGKGPLSDGRALSITSEKSADVGAESIVSYSKKILSAADMAWYIGCSPTSFGNIVRYWDNNGKSNLVQSTTSDTTLITVLADNYMYTNHSTNATDWNNRVTGMTNYWKDRGYSVSVSRNSPGYTTHQTEINNGRPDIVNVVGDPTYSNHDMTGVGYEQYQETTENLKWYRYVIVHDTWTGTPKDVYLYLNNLNSSWNEIVKVIPQ